MGCARGSQPVPAATSGRMQPFSGKTMNHVVKFVFVIFVEHSTVFVHSANCGTIRHGGLGFTSALPSATAD